MKQIFLRGKKVLEAKKLPAVLGANLAAAVVVVGTLTGPAGAEAIYPEVEVATISSETAVVVTDDRFQAPLVQVEVSQGFQRFHQGVDLRAPMGTPVYPVSKGRVVSVVNGRFGYGKWVQIEHEANLASLYAHLGKIDVKEGQEVGKDTVVGEVGLTGWTTGPHLHLELYENGRAINPRQVLPL